MCQTRSLAWAPRHGAPAPAALRAPSPFHSLQADDMLHACIACMHTHTALTHFPYICIACPVTSPVPLSLSSYLNPGRNQSVHIHTWSGYYDRHSPHHQFTVAFQMYRGATSMPRAKTAADIYSCVTETVGITPARRRAAPLLVMHLLQRFIHARPDQVLVKLYRIQRTMLLIRGVCAHTTLRLLRHIGKGCLWRHDEGAPEVLRTSLSSRKSEREP